MRKIFPFIIIFLYLSSSYAQTGQPFLTNFSPQDYNGDGQIWTITQDNRGVMYFGGYNGIYEFDGVSWNTIGISEYQLTIRSMAVDSLGRIYVGSINDMGYLSPDETGKLEFISISSEIDSADLHFTDIWTMQTLGTNVYFCSDEFLFRYNPDSIPKFKVIGRGIPFFLAYKVRNEIFVSTRDRGILKVQGDTLIPLPKSEKMSPWIMLPYEEKKFLVNIDKDGLFVYDPFAKDTSKIITKEYFNKTEIAKTDEFLKTNQMYLGATYLGNDLYALSTIQRGIVIINKKGKIINIIDKQHGLLSQTVHYLFLDNQNQLWAGLTYGLAHIEINSPFQYFDAKMGLKGSIYDVFRHNDYFYGTSNLGIFYWRNGKFNNVPLLTDKNALQVFNPISFKYPGMDKSLFIVTTINGIYEINEDNATKISNLEPNSYIQSRFDSSKIWIQEDFTLYSASIYDKLKDITLEKEFDDILFILGEDDDKNLWLINNFSIVLYNIKTKKINSFENNSELDSIEIYDGKYTDLGMIFYTNKGIYTFNSSTQKFEDFNSIIDNKLADYSIIQFENISENQIWTSQYKGEKSFISIFNKNNGNFVCDTTPFKRLFEFDLFRSDGDSLMWIISPNYLYSFNTKYKKDYSIVNQVIIRKIIATDSVIFYGAFSEFRNGRKILINNQNDSLEIIFKYKNNDLRIEFALPEFDNSSKNEYSYLLIGDKNNKWSKWSTANYQDLTNLHEGQYIFQIKARNIYGCETDISEIKFTVLPPWYRSTWAIFIYFLLLALVIWLAIKIYSIRLKKENERLDKIVKERTAEINQQNEEIKSQSESLTQINKLLVEKNYEVNQQNEEIQAIAESLQKANKNIEEKNSYIIDSINYAQKIQNAVLPSTQNLNNLLKEYFIFFKPKDVISGDFYWTKKIKNHILIIVADCTGHGVPGGFISMLGISVLNEIVHRNEITKPSEALERMRIVIKAALKQNDDEYSQDESIDLGFVAINLTNNNLIFSGANIPLYIIRNKKLITLKSVPNPIGIYPFEQSFKNESIQLINNDMLYMSSDGYKDQFSPNNEQFSLEKFKQLLIEISKTSTKNQQQCLLEEFIDFKRNKPQTDDILVFGVRWKI